LILVWLFKFGWSQCPLLGKSRNCPSGL